MEMEISLPGGLKVEAHWRGHTIKTDQPVVAGGENTAPSPFELCLASIGTCAGFFVVAFCRERDIPTDNIKLFASFEKDRSKGMVTNIKIDIKVPPDFPEKYRQAVVRAAEQCTVVKHLYDPPKVNVFLSEWS